MLAPKQVQADFSAGACPTYARHLIPDTGVYSLQNGLLDSDGGIYKRGGSAVLSTSNFGSTGLRWIWDGYFPNIGDRTLIADAQTFGVLSATEAALGMGAPGLAGPVPTAMLGGLLFIGGGFMYAGSRKSVTYSTGTVGLTNGSATVTGVGTVWNTNADAGMIFQRAGERAYIVKSVDSATGITLSEPYVGVTGAGIAYTLRPIQPVVSPYRSASLYAACGNRIIAAVGNRWYFSDFNTPHVWNANDYWDLPEGVEITGMVGIDNSLRLLTTQGIWQADHLEQDAVDFYGNPQHNLRQITKDIVLWSAPGLATWAGNVIVPATDGVWMISGNSFEKISKSFDDRYLGHVQSGNSAGQAIVFNGHYLLPILDPSNAAVEVLVCRLDRPTRARGQTIYPWSHFSGAGANLTAYASRVATGTLRNPKLLGAGRAATGTFTGRALNLTGYFTPSAGNRNDHDATTPQLIFETRDYPTGPLTQNLVKAMRLSYRLIDAASENPSLAADWSDGEKQLVGSFWGTAFWGSGFWTSVATAVWEVFDSVAPEDDGRTPKFWRMRKKRARTRYVRFRVRSLNPSSECTIRSLELFTRRSGRL